MNGRGRASNRRYGFGDASELIARFAREVWARAITVPSDVNPIELGARALLWVALVWMAWGYVFQPVVRSQMSPNFVHFVLARANLVFHEAGHVLFIPFGEFMTVLGGSLTQVLIPFAFSGVFLLRHGNAYGSAVTLWWTGQSLIDTAPYIADARTQQLVLLGGVTGRDAPGYHDWNNLLRWTGLLHMDRTIATAAHATGSALILLALGWGAWQLWSQYRELRP